MSENKARQMFVNVCYIVVKSVLMCYLYIRQIVTKQIVIKQKHINDTFITHCCIISEKGEYKFDITDLIKQYNVNPDTSVEFYRDCLNEYKNNILLIVFDGDNEIKYKL